MTSEAIITNVRRYLWIDYVKSIGIFLIVYGHLNSNKLIFNFLWTFHVPLFFFIAGFLSVKKNNDLNIRKRIERLLLPYIYMYIISVVISFGVKYVRVHQFDMLALGKSLIGFLWGNDSYSYFVNAPLWFLPSLFIVELIFVLFHTKFSWLIIISPIISIYFYTHDTINIFLSFGLSLLGLNYYFLGYTIKNKNLINRLQKITNFGLALIVIVTFLVVFSLAKINNVWYEGNSIYAYFTSFFGGVVGCLMMIAISLILEQILGELKLVTYISQNTILILGFHFFTNKYANGLISYLGFLPSISKTLFAAILSILMLIPVMMLVNKFCPQIGGRRFAK